MALTPNDINLLREAFEPMMWDIAKKQSEPYKDQKNLALLIDNMEKHFDTRMDAMNEKREEEKTFIEFKIDTIKEEIKKELIDNGLKDKEVRERVTAIEGDIAFVKAYKKPIMTLVGLGILASEFVARSIPA